MKTGTLLVIGTLLGLAIAGGYALLAGDGSLDRATRAVTDRRSAGTEEPTLSTRLLELQQSIDAQDERIALLEERLQDRLAGRERAGDSTAVALGATDPETTADDSPIGDRQRAGIASISSLMDAGFLEADARALMTELDAIQLERLQLVYEVNRDNGSADTSALSQAMQALPSERRLIEERFGADAYDQFLYASERPNRLVVRDVLRNSPAAAIGLQPGDQLISAANRRIYTPGDLMQAASTVQDGQMPLLIRRGETLIETAIPAGPLGVTTGRERINPTAR